MAALLLLVSSLIRYSVLKRHLAQQTIATLIFGFLGNIGWELANYLRTASPIVIGLIVNMILAMFIIRRETRSWRTVFAHAGVTLLFLAPLIVYLVFINS